MSLSFTPLHALHQELGGRLVDFAGWELPIQFEGVVAEHLWCRSSAGLFDVSHMGLLEFRGDDPANTLEQVTPAGITTLKPGFMRYGLLTNDDGGLIDDCMITNKGDHMTMVVNGSRREIALAHLRGRLADVDITERRDVALLALQGPLAVDVMTRLAPVAGDLVFLQAADVVIDGVEIGLSRSGYTGEDGYELIIPSAEAERIARLLLAQPEVKPIGLGARDTLRLEAGLCLYGNDLDDTTSPVEANLVWSMPKRRRDAGDFPGGARVLAELENGPPRIRVGIAAEGKRPVREGSALLDPATGGTIGTVSSGGFGPSIDRPVAMGYVAPDLATVGTSLLADVRGKSVPVVVADLPFSPHRYRRGTQAPANPSTPAK